MLLSMQPHPLRTPVSLQSPVKILMENSGCQMWQTLANTNTHKQGFGWWAVRVAVSKFCWTNRISHRKNMLQLVTPFEQQTSPPPSLIPYSHGRRAVVPLCPWDLEGVVPPTSILPFFAGKRPANFCLTWLGTGNRLEVVRGS